MERADEVLLAKKLDEYLGIEDEAPKRPSARLDALDQHLREYDAEPGEETRALLAAAALSEAARLALRDLAEELVEVEERPGAG